MTPTRTDSDPRLYVESAGSEAQDCSCGAPADMLCWAVRDDDEIPGTEFGICRYCAYERWREPRAEPAKHKRDALVELFNDPHHRPTADSILNELHQAGWKIVPK